jgi:hypothetical protein
MEWIDLIDASKFFDPSAPETDIFALPLVAIALGIGRNKMCKIPVKRIMIDKRAFYKKGDILDWTLSDQGKTQLNELRNQNSQIKRAADAKSKAYDYFYTRDNKSHYQPSRINGETKRDKYKRFCKEIGRPYQNYGYVRDDTSIFSKLWSCNDLNQLEQLMTIARDYREQFIKLRMGLPYGMEKRWWWFEKDVESALAARKQSKRDSILEIEQLKAKLKEKG